MAPAFSFAASLSSESAIFTGYLSDLSDSDNELTEDDIDTNAPLLTTPSESPSPLPTRQPPSLKRQRLEVPARVARQQAQNNRRIEMEQALKDVEVLIQSKKDLFDAGRNGLQAYRARAIQSYLWMVVHNKKKSIEASQRAAESQGFAEKWGGRMVRHWVRKWVDKRELPISSKGRHKKTFSLYDDPAIRAELRSFVRSNKWATNPEKLAEFSKQKMIPEAAKQYLQHVTAVEMPQGLKKYLEVEFFPRIHLKPRGGVSLSTARPNNDMGKGWILDGEQPLRKKGVGRGIHQSDVICSTVGWLKEASQTLEYGKNHEGYWNGELFVKQLKEKIIPAFERAHGPGFQALIMVDNSQGHSAYADDALLTSRMNMRPGGKQADLRDGWFLQDGIKVTQKMTFSNDHPEFPGMPKGIKQILFLRENCDYTFATLKENMPKALDSVGINTIRKWEHRMKRWMEAYESGLGAKDAQFKVKAFSSRTYKSHRRIPEAVACQLDQH
ncbi:hypothetical protein EDD22DRAFT_778846 [Suillus occidentalis]|nr:hypothetical protein EDD22DRAFT_778846 [Suillus occidentalis]